MERRGGFRAYGITAGLIVFAGATGATLGVVMTPAPTPAVQVVTVTVEVPDTGCQEYARHLEEYARGAVANADTLAGLWESGVPFTGLGVREDNLTPASELLAYLTERYGAGCTF
jgi:hypothetical protein